MTAWVLSRQDGKENASEAKTSAPKTATGANGSISHKPACSHEVIDGLASDVLVMFRKLIGGKYYLKGFEAHIGTVNETDFRSARDVDGHGTHTASTSAGNFVEGEASIIS